MDYPISRPVSFVHSFRFSHHRHGQVPARYRFPFYDQLHWFVGFSRMNRCFLFLTVRSPFAEGSLSLSFSLSHFSFTSICDATLRYAAVHYCELLRRGEPLSAIERDGLEELCAQLRAWNVSPQVLLRSLFLPDNHGQRPSFVS
jgi:hypothetical protein